MTDTPHDLTTWPGWLRELRRRKRWSQRELARRLTIVQSTVARWEITATVPSPVMRRLLSYLGNEEGLPPPPKG